jgi:hypothetical protein
MTSWREGLSGSGAICGRCRRLQEFVFGVLALNRNIGLSPHYDFAVIASVARFSFAAAFRGTFDKNKRARTLIP